MRRVIAAAVLAACVVVASAHAAPASTFVQAPGPQGPLKGLLSSPGGKVPVVLVIPGSGNVDRDENGPGIKAAPLRLLAEGLADHGVASVRIDKRGRYASAAAGDANSATVEKMGRDVHAWAGALTAQLGISCIWVAGHSEGGVVAIAAGRDPDQICGLVLISTPGRPLGVIMRDQLHAAPELQPLLPAADAILSKLDRGEHVPAAAIPGPLMALFRPAVQDKLIVDLHFDPTAALASYKGRVMIVQGETDLQVSPVDAQRLANARPDAKLLLVPGMNHVLKIAPLERAANFAAYTDPSLPLAPGVAEAIAAFVKLRAPR
ncbi:MAG: alpha/beta fold hydrolase [Caulobacteraceae bacterium]|nr:alpha/beta fold hydrolase [Caulobacteraceae bacterium]